MTTEPNSLTTLVQVILDHAAVRPEKTALIFRKEQLTYGELALEMKKAAALLRRYGVRRGDRVLFTAPSKPSAFVLYLAAQYLGAAAVPTDKVGMAQRELSLYDDAEAAILITALKMPEALLTGAEEPGNEAGPAGSRKVVALKDFLSEASRIPEAELFPPVTPEMEDLADILFTSGTTGKPKGVMLSFRALDHIMRNTAVGVGIKESDVVLMPLPLHHSLALRCCRATLLVGGTLVLQNGFAFAKETENNQKAFGCTGFVGVPVSMELLRGQMKDRFYEIMGAFRFLEIGAGALTVEQRKRLSANLPDTQITNTWGSSETGGVIFTYVHEVAKDERLVGTLGKVIEGAGLHFYPVNEEESSDKLDFDVKPGTDREHPGRLALSGGMIMSGYWGRKDLTADALRDGCLVTNDLAYADEDGYVFMLGRSDDIINIGGEKLSPLELENVASEYEGAGEYACIGVPDPKGLLGQVPILFAGRCREGYSAADLRAFLAARLERLKLPAAIYEVEALPRNRMEKLDRKAVRALYETMDTGA